MTKKQLEEEGITKEFLSTISHKKLGNPVQLSLNEEPVNLVNCVNGFWVSVNGDLLKDEKNNYIVVSNRNAEIARARYLINFKDEIKAKKIEAEVLRLKKLVDDKTDELVSQLEELLFYAGKLKDIGIKGTLINSIRYLNAEREKAKKATEIVNDNTVRMYENLLKEKELGEEKDYDRLYIYFFQNNLPEIASFKTEDLSVLVNSFHKDVIDSTINEINNNSHLENIAKFNVDKKN